MSHAHSRQAHQSGTTMVDTVQLTMMEASGTSGNLAPSAEILAGLFNINSANGECFSGCSGIVVMEAGTDPLGTAWYDRSGNEIGDKCAWIFGPLNAGGGDVTWNGNSYEVQEEWDNTVSSCVLSGP